MKTKTAFLFLVLATMIGCNAGPSVVLNEGYYQLKITESPAEGNSLSAPTLNFMSATLHVKNADSLEFPGWQNIGDALWGHSRFAYQIEGSQITLSDNDFSQKLNIGYTADSLLRLEVNADAFKTIYFERLVLREKGMSYQVAGFELAKGAENTNISEYTGTLFSQPAFHFGMGDTVVIAPALARYLTKDAQLADSVFTYQIGKSDITFSQAGHTLKMPYFYDGAVRLSVDDPIFKRLDLAEVKKPQAGSVN